MRTPQTRQRQKVLGQLAVFVSRRFASPRSPTFAFVPVSGTTFVAQQGLSFRRQICFAQQILRNTIYYQATLPQTFHTREEENKLITQDDGRGCGKRISRLAGP
ncbi:hypothetical protein EJ05DRAFT_476771 [Pseudovirgaria hyperparasitica]|uniref:Uncharacterized protein n=1 Tax=Pseudovirgaria hyperparasitica TaxID=470096 RepID=A0A6A6W3U4_9PEZI|nr:uncharacterized protein EJ05DRAFT_476771 [Pseudovirgaria hyperparasitica]KAF2757522.1 hypothetical protein EJ05DRAFT_476771 [Pseudovirgaria hyperparasitica]